MSTSTAFHFLPILPALALALAACPPDDEDTVGPQTTTTTGIATLPTSSSATSSEGSTGEATSDPSTSSGGSTGGSTGADPTAGSGGVYGWCEIAPTCAEVGSSFCEALKILAAEHDIPAIYGEILAGNCRTYDDPCHTCWQLEGYCKSVGTDCEGLLAECACVAQAYGELP